jgi:hypothetical protein
LGRWQCDARFLDFGFFVHKNQLTRIKQNFDSEFRISCEELCGNMKTRQGILQGLKIREAKMNCDACGKKVSSWSIKYGPNNTAFCKDCFGTEKAKKLILEKEKQKEPTYKKNEIQKFPPVARKDLEAEFSSNELISINDFVNKLVSKIRILYFLPGFHRPPAEAEAIIIDILLFPIRGIWGLLSIYLLPLILLYQLILLIMGKGFSGGYFIFLTENEIILLNDIRNKFFSDLVSINPSEIKVIPYKNIKEISGAFLGLLGKVKLTLSDDTEIVLVKDNSISWKKKIHKFSGYTESMAAIRTDIIKHIQS